VTKLQLALVIWQSSSDFARHLVSPELLLDVARVIEETSVEVIAGEYVFGAINVDAAAGVGICRISPHRDVLARLDKRGVSKEGVDDAASMTGLVG